MKPIIAHVDLEGRPHPTRTVRVKVHGQEVELPQMMPISVSIGFEDGASRSLWSDDAREIMRWVVDQLGQTARHEDRPIVAQGFHFGWDSAILARDYDPADMELIQKVGTTQKNAVRMCRRVFHDPGDDECALLLHAYDPKHVQAVITEGGESQVVAWDRKSELAFAITPRRRMYIERRPNGDRFEGWSRVDIHDVGAAFPPPNSLEQVIEDWRPDISPEQRAAIAWGKAARSRGFLDGTPEQIMAYSEAECVAAAKCVRKLINTIERTTGIEIEPKKVFGAGSIAYQVFSHHGVLKARDVGFSGAKMAGLYVNDLPILDYFGGTIETPVIGRVVGLLDQEDLNSAYPAQMAALPCMRSGHGTWIKRQGNLDSKDAGAAVGHVLVTWDWRGVQTSTAPFEVHLKNGAVRTAIVGSRVVVPIARYRAAKAEQPDKTIAHQAVWWEQTCDCPPPFAWVVELYEQRNVIKRQMKTVEHGSPEWHELNMQQLAVKLILNSGYGKLAQMRPEPGPYTNLHYASAITGGTRAAVATEAWRLERTGGIVCYQHTDSELFIGGDKLPHTKELGGWGQEDASADQLLVQPGLSFSLAADLNAKGRPTSGKTATRGCDPAKFVAAAHEWAASTDFTQRPEQWPSMYVEQERMVSRRLAIFQGHPERAGCFLPHNLEINVISGKREFMDAYPMPGQPEAWIVPPRLFVPAEDIATLEDLRIYQRELAERIKRGLEDSAVDLDGWLSG